MPGVEWNPEVSVGDVLTFIALAIAAGTLYFAGHQVEAARVQMEDSARSQRAQHLLAIYQLYFGHEKTREFFYKLDWGKWHFDEKRIADAEEEPWLDSLLYNLDVIGRMVRIGALKAEDAALIAFQAARVLSNKEVKLYLDWLRKDYADHGLPPPHQDARYLAGQLSSSGE